MQKDTIRVKAPGGGYITIDKDDFMAGQHEEYLDEGQASAIKQADGRDALSHESSAAEGKSTEGQRRTKA